MESHFTGLLKGKDMARTHLVGLLIMIVAITGSGFSQESMSPSLNLEQCIRQALDQNPGFTAAAYRVRESQTLVRESRSAWYPTVNFSMGARQYPIEEKPGAPDESYTAGVTARYTLFDGFRRTNSVEAFQSGYRAEEMRLQFSRDDLVYQVTEAYYRLWQAAELVRVGEQSLERARIHLEYAETRFETGLATRSDILKARVEESNAQLALTRARNTQQTAAGRLNVLMGQPAHQALSIEGVSDTRQIDRTGNASEPTQLGDRLTSLAFRHRPDLQSVEQQIRAQEASLGAARSEYFPTLALETNFSTYGTAPTALEPSSSSYMGLSLSVPLFTGFRQSARVQRESLTLQRLHQERRQVRDQVSEDVWNAYLAMHEARERIANTELLYANADENLRIAEGEYQEGTGSMLELIDAQTALVDADERRIEAFRDYHTALARLRKVTGTDNVEEILE